MKEGSHICRIQFHWMARVKKLPELSHMDLENELAEAENSITRLVKSFTYNDASDKSVFSAKTKWPIYHGDVFSVTFSKAEDCKHFADVMDIQWALIRLAAMSGAADVFDSDSPNYDPDWKPDLTPRQRVSDDGVSDEEIDPEKAELIRSWRESVEQPADPAAMPPRNFPPVVSAPASRPQEDNKAAERTTTSPARTSRPAVDENVPPPGWR